MAAPTAVLTHGSAIDLVDEPASSSVIQAEKFNFKGAREERKSRKYDGSTFRIQKRDPHATMTLNGFILGSGLAIQEAGTEVTALANFAPPATAVIPPSEPSCSTKSMTTSPLRMTS